MLFEEFKSAHIVKLSGRQLLEPKNAKPKHL